MKKFSIPLLLVFFLSGIAYGQKGTIKGTITDSVTHEAIPFANIIFEKGGVIMEGTTSDFEGKSGSIAGISFLPTTTVSEEPPDPNNR
jgi:hypothetical protein